MPHVTNGQFAGIGNLASLLIGDATTSFASLLDLGTSESDLAHQGGGARGKQADRLKDKESKEVLRSASQNPGQLLASTSTTMPTTRSLSPASWHFDRGDIHSDSGEDGASLSPPSSPASTSEAPARQIPRGVLALTGFVASSQRDIEGHAAEIAPMHVPDNTGRGAPTKDATLVGPHSEPAGSTAQPPDAAVTAGVSESSFLPPNSVQLPAENIGNGVRADAGRLVAVQELQRFVPSNPKGEPAANGIETSAITPGESLSDVPVRSGVGQGSLTEPLQGNISETSSAMGGGHTQGSESDTHKGPRDTNGSLADSRVLVPQVQTNPSQALGSGGSAHGHMTIAGSTHLVSARETAPDSQLKELASSQVRDPNAVRLLGSAMRSDLRLGVQTEAFGKVTIQTTTQGNQLTAQLSLENTKEGAALAAHLPGVEQRIIQQHGLSASVRLANTFDGGAGAGFFGRDQSGSGRREPERYQANTAIRAEGSRNESSSRSSGVEVPVAGSRYSASSVLDVTV